MSQGSRQRHRSCRHCGEVFLCNSKQLRHHTTACKDRAPKSDAREQADTDSVDRSKEREPSLRVHLTPAALCRNAA